MAFVEGALELADPADEMEPADPADAKTLNV